MLRCLAWQLLHAVSFMAMLIMASNTRSQSPSCTTCQTGNCATGNCSPLQNPSWGTGPTLRGPVQNSYDSIPAPAVYAPSSRPAINYGYSARPIRVQDIRSSPGQPEIVVGVQYLPATAAVYAPPQTYRPQPLSSSVPRGLPQGVAPGSILVEEFMIDVPAGMDPKTALMLHRQGRSSPLPQSTSGYGASGIPHFVIR